MNQQEINSQSMLRVGTILRGIYRIDSYLSSGGFGNTYVATNIEFDERVAIKEFFMKGVSQRDDNQTAVSVSNAENSTSFLEQKEKFKKEARRIRQLKNEHIVSVHDLFEENGTAYYVMDYVDGENLAERLKRTGNPLTEEDVRAILPQILDALKSVHDAGIWHLDLKPANIMLDKDGNVKLIDFGASKQLNAQKGGATTSTAISYTNGYAPREQMEQNYDKFGPWTDIYALGATLYNLLTNKRPPLPSDIDDDESVDKHLSLPFTEGISDEMKKLVLQLMQTNRKNRPQNVGLIPIFASSDETATIPCDAQCEEVTFLEAKKVSVADICEETIIQPKIKTEDEFPENDIKTSNGSKHGHYMILTGVGMLIFLTLHCSVNFVALFFNVDSSGIYSILNSNPIALIVTVPLALAVMVHIVYMFYLSASGRIPRRNVLILSTIILAGLFLHLSHFWYNMMWAELAGFWSIIPPFFGLRWAVEILLSPVNAAIYIIWLITIWYYLFYSLWSSLEYLDKDRYAYIKGRIKICKILVTILVAMCLFLVISIVFEFAPSLEWLMY